MLPSPLLPSEALARWQTLERLHAVEPGGGADPGTRLARWIARLDARACCSSGRLANLVVATGLDTIDAIVACVLAQLDAGPLLDDALRFDLEHDLFALCRLASDAALAQVSTQLSRVAWRRRLSGADSIHVELAGRLLACDPSADVGPVLERVGWYEPLLRFIERHAADLPRGVRDRAAAHAWALVEASPLPRESLVEPAVRIAVAIGDRAYIDRAREICQALPTHALAATPDVDHPVESLAWGLARLGDFGAAMAAVAPLAPGDRWSALSRLAPLSPDPSTRAALVDELVALVEPLELSWAWLVEAVPETAERALEALGRLADELSRLEAICATARFMPPAVARRACASALEIARRADLVPGSARWVEIWAALLSALRDSGCADLLDPAARLALVDLLLGEEDLDLWDVACGFVPDQRVDAVLERSRARLPTANRYLDRQAWIDLGLAVLPRAGRLGAESWLAETALAMPAMALDDATPELLDPWSLEQRRAMVSARLAAHQTDFLPSHVTRRWKPVVERWLCRDEGAVDRASADDDATRAWCSHALDELIARTAWPTGDDVLWAFAYLGRCVGPGAVEAMLRSGTETSSAIQPAVGSRPMEAG